MLRMDAATQSILNVLRCRDRHKAVSIPSFGPEGRPSTRSILSALLPTRR
eukprot:m.225048 g.225048  ORF g.225048 m.225048 type:complete len:50 (+) comp17302_c0_seq21:608-757(+)